MTFFNLFFSLQHFFNFPFFFFFLSFTLSLLSALPPVHHWRLFISVFNFLSSSLFCSISSPFFPCFSLPYIFLLFLSPCFYPSPPVLPFLIFHLYLPFFSCSCCLLQSSLPSIPFSLLHFPSFLFLVFLLFITLFSSFLSLFSLLHFSSFLFSS